MNTEQKRQKFLEIIEAAGSTFVGIEFVKKDGSPGKGTFNPRDFNEIKGTGKPSKDPYLFKFRKIHNKDEKKTAWRSCRIERLVSVAAKGKKVMF